MIDVAAQIAYWRVGAEEDWAVARELLDKGRVRHSLFMAHLALWLSTPSTLLALSVDTNGVA